MKELVKGRLWQGMRLEAELLKDNYLWEAKGIRSVLSVAWDCQVRFVPQLPQLALPVREDYVTPARWFDMAVEFHHEFASTLVYCHAGANRSRVFAAALLVGVHGVTIEDALRVADPPPDGMVTRSLIEWARTR